MSSQTFEFIENSSPKEIRNHLNNLRNLPQCSNEKFWNSLLIIEMFLIAKGLAEECPNRTTSKVIENNKIYFRKDKQG